YTAAVVENLSPDELRKEISRLWEKVGTSATVPLEDVPPAGASPLAASGELAWETVAMLKSQYRRQERRWAEVLEAREAALRALKARQEALDAEAASLRSRLRTDDQRVMTEVLDAGARLEAAGQALEEERRARQDESRELKALLDAAREAAAAEGARWREEERRWQKKEQRYLLDLQELQALAGRRQEETARADDAAGRLSGSLQEAKSALEKTLAELLQERRVRQETEAERAKAVQKISEVEKHFEELSRIWEEERSQWRELWDRERAAWEGQRLEFSAWEENLRKEREAWHSDISAKDQAQVKFAEQLTRNLRDTSATSEKLAAVMSRLADVERRPPVVVAREAPAPGRRRRPVLAWAAAAALLLAAAAWPLWRLGSAWTVLPLSSRAVPLGNPTAMAWDGELLWIADWNGALEAFDAAEPGAARRSLKVLLPGSEPGRAEPYRPLALAAGREIFYSLDAAKARIVRHRPDDPAAILYTKPAPGPAPTALAWDGKALWSYDAVNKSLYRHGSDEADAKPYALAADVVPTAMAWVGSRLWIYDSRGRRVLAFDFAQGAFAPAADFAVGEGVVGLAATGPFSRPRTAEVSVLLGPTAQRPGFALARWRCGPRLFTIF
ncbi:MAG: hypothetical protein PHF00_02885, partial [Elusimicrobia bacterium]|nr:hypothetical protein [Elusimicrobiota bacterium]